jgi:protein O-mannosyl-transferase
LLLSEWVGFGWPRWRGAAVIGGAVVVLALAIPLGWRLVFPQPAAEDGAVNAELATKTPPLVYLRTQAIVLPRYLGLTLAPWGQNVDHDVPLAESLSPRVAAGMALLTVLALIGVTQIRSRPLLGFALCWFFVTHSVESSLYPINDVMAEHRMYLPMAGPALLAGALYVAAAARAPHAAPAAGALVVAILVSLTFARNLVWRSPVTLWLDAAEKAPGKNRPHVNLGVAYIGADRLDEAAREFCRALHIDPGDTVANENLAAVLEAQGAIDEIAVRADGSAQLEMEEVASYCPQILSASR